MGRDLLDFPGAKETFRQADDALGFSLSDLMFDGPESLLTDTVNAQPAILVHSIVVLRILAALAPDLRPIYVAGHSFGEYSALVAAGALEFADAVRLVRARGEAMKLAGALRPGAMAAVLGLSDSLVEQVCAKVGGIQVANYNAPGQVVISGEKQAIELATLRCKEMGARRVLPLAVSIPAHSAMMEPAAIRFAPAVAAVPISLPRFPVVSNLYARELGSPAEIRQELVRQLTSPVQWVRTVQFMLDRGVERMIEVGPKDILAGLNRRIAPATAVTSIGNRSALAAFVASRPARWQAGAGH